MRVTVDEAAEGLTRSLALVAPVGMHEEDRTQWIASATAAILDANIGPDEFARAAAAARVDPMCDHHGKIVPSIIRALGDDWRPKIRQELTEDQLRERMAERSAYAVERDWFEDIWGRLQRCEMQQDEIDALPDKIKRLADVRLILRKHDDGQYRYWKAHLAQARAAA